MERRGRHAEFGIERDGRINIGDSQHEMVEAQDRCHSGLALGLDVG